MHKFLANLAYSSRRMCHVLLPHHDLVASHRVRAHSNTLPPRMDRPIQHGPGLRNGVAGRSTTIQTQKKLASRQYGSIQCDSRSLGVVLGTGESADPMPQDNPSSSTNITSLAEHRRLANEATMDDITICLRLDSPQLGRERSDPTRLRSYHTILTNISAGLFAIISDKKLSARTSRRATIKSGEMACGNPNNF